MTLASFRAKHSGPVAILGNGPTLNASLAQIPLKLPIIGTNRSWKVYPSTYQFVAEKKHIEDALPSFTMAHKRGSLFVAGEGFPLGISIPLRRDGTTFSRDMEQGVVVSIGRAGSVVYGALQLAAWMGFGPLYLLGVDLYGDHFDGTPASKELHLQNELFRLVPKDVEVYVVGSPESKATFPRKEWTEVAA